MEPTRKQIEKDGVTYIFRMPTAMDMIQIDLKARELRQGITDGLGVAFSFSQSVAMLNQLCEQPQKTDFGTLRFDTLDELSQEVTEWINSFRKPLGEKQGTVDSTAG